MRGASTEDRRKGLLVSRATVDGAPVGVVLVVVVVVMMMMMMVMVIIKILRNLRIGLALRRLRCVNLLEERQRVGDRCEELRKGLRPQKFGCIAGIRRGRLCIV